MSLAALATQDAADWLIEVQEALVQAAEVHEALVQEADVQLALVQEADVQLALVQEALVQEAEVQLALIQAGFTVAALVQLAASKTGSDPPAGSAVRKPSRARLGLGGLIARAALAASISPTPNDWGAASGVGRAVSMSAPFT